MVSRRGPTLQPEVRLRGGLAPEAVPLFSLVARKGGHLDQYGTRHDYAVYRLAGETEFQAQFPGRLFFTRSSQTTQSKNCYFAGGAGSRERSSRRLSMIRATIVDGPRVREEIGAVINASGLLAGGSSAKG